MDWIAQLIPILFTLSLALIIGSIGLEADIDDVLCVFRRPKDLLRAVLAVNVLVPIAAVVVVSIFPLSAVSKAGIILMAVSPVPPLVPGNAIKAGSHKSYAYGLYVALIVLAVVLVPLSVEVMSSYFKVEFSISVAAIAENVALTVLLPLAVGLGLRQVVPVAAAWIKPVIGRLAVILLVVALIPMVISLWPVMASLVGDGTLAAIILVVLLALVFGHLLGGPDIKERAALAMAASTRHPGMAMMIAAANFSDKRINAAIILFLLVGLIASTPYKVWMKRREAQADLGLDNQT